MPNPTPFSLESRDILNSNEGELWMFSPTNNQYRRMGEVRNITATLNVDNQDFRLLGEIMHRHKAVGMSGEFSCTIYTGTPEFTEWLASWKSSAASLNNVGSRRFRIIAKMADTETGVGSRQVILKECLFNGTQLFKLDTEPGILDEELSGTFDDFQIIENFSEMPNQDPSAVGLPTGA